MSFRLFGFPVRIEGSFLMVIGFIGFSASTELDRVLAWLVIAVVAVLVHELGHAFAARFQGTIGTPTITLAGMAGLTQYRPRAALSRLQSIFISAAGPAAGVLAGAIVLAVRQAELVEDTGLTNAAFDIALFTTFGWSAFNLLPIVPLDGGHIMTDLLPGSPIVRRRRAAAVSILVAVAVGAWLWVRFDVLFAPLVLAMIAFSNVAVITGSRRVRTTAPPAPARPDPPVTDDRGFPPPPQ